ncbi:MAG TPA: hypothetical protein PLN54_01380 [Flavobacteriales bacterium]|nr:hypothetical protein [Flavobacteriales bacterium]
MAYVPPASGRATIVTTLNGALITIPSRRNWFIILFLGAWTGGWAFGGGMALLNLFKPDMPVLARGFLFFWLCGWGTALWFVGRTLYLQFRGNEVISVTRETLSITRPGRFRTTQRNYALNDVRRLRVQADQGSTPFGMVRSSSLHEPPGTLRFDHGMGSVTFAVGIDEPEARHILNFLRDQGLINEANLA